MTKKAAFAPAHVCFIALSRKLFKGMDVGVMSAKQGQMTGRNAQSLVGKGVIVRK